MKLILYKFLLAFILNIIFSANLLSSDHIILEIKDDSLEVTRLNKLFPKPMLENIYGENKYTRSIYGKGCKGSEKNKEIKIYEGSHTIDIFLACRITSPLGYHDHLRKIADEKAHKYCKSNYRSKTYYRGPSFVSNLDGQFWRLVGDGLSLGLLINKRTVGLSYVCSDISLGPNLNNLSNRRVCEQATSVEGVWLRNEYANEAKLRNLNISSCNSLTGRDPLRRIDMLSLCKKATTMKGKWESYQSSYSAYRKEADRRDITLESCNAATGRGKQSDDKRNEFKKLSDESICKLSTNIYGKWIENYNINWKYKLEADARNLSLYRCNDLTGFNSKFNNLTKKELCLRATTPDGKWEPKEGSFGPYRIESIKRKYNLAECNNITGRDDSTATIKKDLSNFSNEFVCRKATTVDGSWEPYEGSLGQYRKEVDRRSLKISECNSITKRGEYAPAPADTKDNNENNLLFLITLFVIIGIVVLVLISLNLQQKRKEEKKRLDEQAEQKRKEEKKRLDEQAEQKRKEEKKRQDESKKSINEKELNDAKIEGSENSGNAADLKDFQLD